MRPSKAQQELQPVVRWLVGHIISGDDILCWVGRRRQGFRRGVEWSIVGRAALPKGRRREFEGKRRENPKEKPQTQEAGLRYPCYCRYE